MPNPNGGDVVRHPSRLVSRGGEKRSAESRFATLNVAGGMEEKMNEVWQMMDTRKIDVLCVNETKRKGCDVTRHGPYTAYWSGVPASGRACQGVGLILSARMSECVKEYECVNARLMWMRMKVGLSRVFVIGVYAPINRDTRRTQKGQDERDEWWDQLRDVLSMCKENERLMMLGDFNGWVGVKRDGFERVLGSFGDERVNENGRNLVDICLEWNLCVTNTMFKHKDIHMYTREAKNVRKSMIDFVIVDESLRKNVLDTRVYRGIAIHSDHFLVVSRISGLFRKWRHRPSKPTSELERIKVENLQDELVRQKYESRLTEKFDKMSESNDVDDLWQNFKENLVNVAREVCGVSKRKKAKTVKNIWWDKDVQNIVCEKKKAWLDWIATRANERMQKVTIIDVKQAREAYQRKRREVKDMVKRKKSERKDELDERMSMDFQTNVKIFWKSIRSARGINTSSELVSVRDKNGEIVKGEDCVLKVWKEYFEGLFEREGANVPSSVMNDNVDEEKIGIDEIVKALKCMKAGKSAGCDRITVEMLRAGQGLIVNKLWTLFDLCWKTGQVPTDWRMAVIVPLYKGKGSRQDCKNYRGISLLSTVGKLYARVLIERVMKVTDKKIWDVQAGFRKGMGCTDQVFSLRCIVEKILAKHQKVYCVFVDLEKAYDRVVRNEMWSVLSIYGVSGLLIQALKSLYEDSCACVRINGSYTELFDIQRGVRQGCVASPWLFNLYMDSCLKDLKDCELGLRMKDLLIKCLLYADDQVILASSEEELQEMVNIVNESFKRKAMKVNVSKTKAMIFERDESMTACNIRIDGEQVEQVKDFVYLGTLFTRDGKNEEDIEKRVNAGNRVNGALHSFMKSRRVSQKAHLAVHNGVLVPTLMYNSESWVWQKKHESRINAVEMRALRSMCGISLKDRIKNEEIRKRCGMKEDVITKIEKGMLRWFGHMERMNKERVTKQVYEADVDGRTMKGRPRRKYLDQIQDILKKGNLKSYLNRRGCMNKIMSVQEARQVCQDRSKWKSAVSAYPSGKQA